MTSKQQPIDLLITGIGQLATARGSRPKTGRSMDELQTIPDASIGIRGTDIVGAGPRGSWEEGVEPRETVDLGGRLVTPGLVDPHTHAVFIGTRADEYDRRIRGVPYMEIAEEGGGIRASVRGVREADRGMLVADSLPRFRRMLAHGTTTAEVKSGYGLTLIDEIKMLEAVREIDGQQPVELVATFLGAHEYPDEYRDDHEGYLKELCERMIPEVVAKRLAEYCDVFCEEGVFSVEESRRVLEAAKNAGLKIRLHAEEFATIGGAVLAGELGAASADHLMAVDAKGIDALKNGGTVGVILPGTAFTLGVSSVTHGRKLVDAGVPVAIGTDCNPGSCYSESMPMMMSIACSWMKLTPAEALTAATLNAACSLDRGERIGTIERGKQADLVAWDAADYREIPYHFGVNLVKDVFKKGKSVSKAT